MSVNREVATQTEVLALGTQLVLRLNEVARSRNSELAKIGGTSRIFIYIREGTARS